MNHGIGNDNIYRLSLIFEKRGKKLIHFVFLIKLWLFHLKNLSIHFKLYSSQDENPSKDFVMDSLHPWYVLGNVDKRKFERDDRINFTIYINIRIITVFILLHYLQRRQSIIYYCCSVILKLLIEDSDSLNSWISLRFLQTWSSSTSFLTIHLFPSLEFCFFAISFCWIS